MILIFIRLPKILNFHKNKIESSKIVEKLKLKREKFFENKFLLRTFLLPIWDNYK